MFPSTYIAYYNLASKLLALEFLGPMEASGNQKFKVFLIVSFTNPLISRQEDNTFEDFDYLNPISTRNMCFSTNPSKMKFSKADFSTFSTIISKSNSSSKYVAVDNIFHSAPG